MGTEPNAHPFIKLHNKKSYIDYSACRFWENKIKVLFQLRLLVLFSKLHLIFLRISGITLKSTCVYLILIYYPYIYEVLYLLQFLGFYGLECFISNVLIRNLNFINTCEFRQSEQKNKSFHSGSCPGVSDIYFFSIPGVVKTQILCIQGVGVWG